MHKKGTSQAMWIIISIVITLAVALIIVMVFSSSTSKTGKQTENTNKNTGDTINAQLCQAKCDTCKQIYGSECAGKWADFSGAQCESASCT